MLHGLRREGALWEPTWVEGFKGTSLMPDTQVSSLSVLLDLASGRLSPVVAWNPDRFFHLILSPARSSCSGESWKDQAMVRRRART